MIKFSIIVPIYNVEKYLENCLNSIAHQTFNDYEVIIVCDKCQDNSEKIANNYVTKYKWQKIYEENTGLAKARNLGVAKSKGEYLIFIDGDDYVKEDFLETLNNSLNDKPDVLRFQIQDRLENKVVEHKEKGFKIVNGIDAFEKIIKYYYIENAWAYCYNRAYWQTNKFKYMEGCIAEDYGLTPIIIAQATKVKSIPYIGYNYVQRYNSLMNNSDYKFKLKKMDDMLKQYNFEKSLLRKIKNNEVFIRFLNNSLIYYSTTLKYKDFKKYKKILKEKDCFSHLKGKSLKHKIRNFMIKSNAYFYYNYIMRLK